MGASGSACLASPRPRGFVVATLSAALAGTEAAPSPRSQLSVGQTPTRSLRSDMLSCGRRKAPAPAGAALVSVAVPAWAVAGEAAEDVARPS
eukprot:5344995-Pleurochrysis_carterae.AAC.1